MTGYVDLHCHPLPAIDDGARTAEEGLALLRGLGSLGYTAVVATPHMRSGLFENDRDDILKNFESFQIALREIENLPELFLGCEHHFDERFWACFRAKGLVPIAEGRALLIELPPDAMPPGIAQRIYQLALERHRIVLAHPERYAYLYRATSALRPLIAQGVVPMLDLMSLVGRYGRAPQRAAERMLEEGVYGCACSDAHRPSDLPHVESALTRLIALVGGEEARALLADNPRRLLASAL